MAQERAPDLVTQIPAKKRIVFALIIILASISVALVSAELLFRFKINYIQKSNHLDEGMIKYDNILGWRLTSNWSGRHRHYDFDVKYTTNSFGFRGDFMRETKRGGLKYAFVGDSFTFSIGVNDHETFIFLLNSQKPQLNASFNFGIPGFSTDQEYLLIKDQVLYFHPDVVMLVVYLGNDLFDNELAFPLQADNAKPFYELTKSGLVLKNSPVPLKTKPKNSTQRDLMKVVYGGDYSNEGLAARLLGRFELLRFFNINLYRQPELSQFDGRFDYQLRLFFAIVEKIRQTCEKKKVQLNLVLMPGRSYVQRPGSPSAVFQDYLRDKIVKNEKAIKVRVIDLAGHLRVQYEKSAGRLYYPNEGHLTPAGNQVVADILTRALIKNIK